MATDGAGAVTRPSLRKQMREALAGEAQSLLFALRTSLAILLALGVAFRLDLDSPGSAAITVVIVSMSQAGQVVEKSFYRLLGTLTGGLLSLLLVAVFVQQREPFVLAVALWMGAAVMYSAWQRGFRAYAAVLAGYTAILVGFPAIQQPDLAFQICIDRITAVLLGVVCGGVINAVILPQSAVPALIAAVRRRYPEFVEFAEAVLQRRASKDAQRSAHSNFARDVLALDALRVTSSFEAPESRIRGSRLRRLNSDFMLAATSLHTYDRLLQELHSQGRQQALQDLLQELLDNLRKPDGELPRMAAETAPVVACLQAWLEDWDGRAESIRQQQMAQGDAVQLACCEQALALLQQFAEHMLRYLKDYARLLQSKDADARQVPALVVHTDPLVALGSGVRVSLALLAVSSFWILSGWSDGFSAVLLTGVCCALFAAAPLPLHAVAGMARGFALGMAAAILFYGVLLPQLDGFSLLATTLLPFLLLGARWMARPESMGQGTGYMLMLLSAQTLANDMQVDIPRLFNQGVATFIGLSIAAVAYAVILPAGSPWIKKRLRRAMGRQILVAAYSKRQPVRHYFESRVRDLLVQRLSQPGLSADARDIAVDEALVILEVGQALLYLRELMPGDELAGLLQRVTVAFCDPQPQAIAAAQSLLEDMRQRLPIRPAKQGSASVIDAGETTQDTALLQRRAFLVLHLALREWRELAQAEAAVLVAGSGVPGLADKAST